MADSTHHQQHTVERHYFPNGALREEIHLTDGRHHGPWREWFQNGQLAAESIFYEGVYWTGVNRSWHENGQLAGEQTWLNGNQVGRQSVYESDGFIVQLYYALDGKAVSRAEYDAACLQRSDLPRYTDTDPPGCGARPRMRTARPTEQTRKSPPPAPSTRAQTRERSQAFAEELLATKHEEASTWLVGDDSNRGIGEHSHGESMELVKRLYAKGATRVFVVDIKSATGLTDQNCEDVLVELPVSCGAREALFRYANSLMSEYGYDAAADVGQGYIYLRFA